MRIVIARNEGSVEPEGFARRELIRSLSVERFGSTYHGKVPQPRIK